MAKQWQIRRGTTVENNDFTGAIGELTMDTDTKGIRIHDGFTQGGIEVPTAGTADYVVEWQTPDPNNSYKWYRKYKSGWVEQGGKITVGEQPTTTTHTMTLLVEMADTEYFIEVRGCTGDTSSNVVSVQYGHEFYGAVWDTGKTTTSFNYRTRVGGSWEVKGMAA